MKGYKWIVFVLVGGMGVIACRNTKKELPQENYSAAPVVGAVWSVEKAQQLKVYGRPLVCTEYMARPSSLFADIMPMLKEQQIGAINWGLVSGKTNTIYAWNTPVPDGSEPEPWFHDIFRRDGRPYRQEEVELIRQLASQ